MSIDLDPIYTEFKKRIDEISSDKLSKFRGLPAVFTSYAPKAHQSYPFVVIGISNIQAPVQSVSEYYNTDCKLISNNIYSLFVNISVFSSEDATNRAEQIALDLHSGFSRRGIQQLLCDKGIGSIIDIGQINPSSFKKDNSVGEAATFFIKFSAISEEATTTQEITSISGDMNSRFSGSQEDTLTIPIEVNTPED